MGKILAHKSASSVEKWGRAESANLAIFARCGAIASASVLPSRRLVRSTTRTHGQSHAGRIGAVDDVEIVVAGQHQHELRKLWMPRKIVEELGPFGGNSRIGHVAGEEDAIERLTHMGRLELSEQPLEPLIAAG